MTVEVETNAPKKGEQVQGYLTGQVKPDQSEEGQSPNAVTQILVDPWSLHSLTQKKHGGGPFVEPMLRPVVPLGPCRHPPWADMLGIMHPVR